MRVFFGFCFITSLVFSQGDAAAIQHIKSKYQEISELEEKKLLTEKEIWYSCEDQSLSGSLTYYYHNQELKLIFHSFDQGHYYAFHHYYISDDALFFYFCDDGFDNHENIYDKKTGEWIDTKENWSSSELRVYFDKKKAIKCLVKEYDNEDVTEEIKQQYSDVSLFFKNEEKECDTIRVQEILNTFSNLVKFSENPCAIHN